MDPLAGTGKAPLGKRAAALIIDGIIAGVIAAVFGMLGSRMGGIGVLVGAAYTLCRDGLTLEFANGRSVGKQLMGLGVSASTAARWTSRRRSAATGRSPSAPCSRASAGSSAAGSARCSGPRRGRHRPRDRPHRGLPRGHGRARPPHRRQTAGTEVVETSPV